MNTDIRDLILDKKDVITPNDLVGLRLKHPYYGTGNINAYCCECQRVTVEFDDSATVVHEDLYDLLCEDSGWKVSLKQFERKFVHLRSSSKAAPKRASSTTGNVSPSNVTPSTSYIPRIKTKQRTKKGPPTDATPLYPDYTKSPMQHKPFGVVRKRKLKGPAPAGGLPIRVQEKQEPMDKKQPKPSTIKAQGNAMVNSKANAKAKAKTKVKPTQNSENDHRQVIAHDDFEIMDDGEDYGRYQDVDFGEDGDD
jgi:hypothetical protein